MGCYDFLKKNPYVNKSVQDFFLESHHVCHRSYPILGYFSAVWMRVLSGVYGDLQVMSRYYLMQMPL